MSALTAFCFLLNTYALRFSHEGRPYALLIASACASLLAWQAASRRPTLLGLGILAGSLSVGPFVHYYGVFHYLPVIVGEALSSIKRRALSRRMVLSLAGSFLPLLWLYPFASHAVKYKNTSLVDFGVSSIFKAYPELTTEAVFPGTMSLLICLVLLASRVAGGERPHSKWSFGVPEFGAGLQLCLIPFVGYVVALHTGALTTKYVIVTAVGLAIVVACTCDFIKTRHHTCSIAILLCFGLSGVYQLAILAQPNATPQDLVSPSLSELVRQAESPVVFSDPHFYLQAYHYLPQQLRGRVFYLSDRVLATDNGQSTGDDLALALLRKVVPIQMAHYPEFIARNSRFMVVDSGGWLTAKLLENGLKLSLQALGSDYRVLRVEAVP